MNEKENYQRLKDILKKCNTYNCMEDSAENKNIQQKENMDNNSVIGVDNFTAKGIKVIGVDNFTAKGIKVIGVDNFTAKGIKVI